LLEAKPADRVKWLAEQTDQKFTGQAAEGLKKAESLEDLLAALEKKIARYVTPNVVPKGAMVLQPSDERRRSGSHYTPRSLTEPIVRTTLRPVLESFNRDPTGSASVAACIEAESSPDALPVGSDFKSHVFWTLSVACYHLNRKSNLKSYSHGMRGSMSSASRRLGRPS
jgi:hypothetical protein